MRVLCSLESLAAGFATNLVLCEGGNATRSRTTRTGAHPKQPGPPRILLLQLLLLYRCKLSQDRTVIKGGGRKDGPATGASLLLQLLMRLLLWAWQPVRSSE